MLGFEKIAPQAPALRPYVDCFWYFHSAGVLPQSHAAFMNPEGGFGVVFNLGDALQLDGQPATARMFLDGTTTFSRQMTFSGQVGVLGIRFYPGGAYPFWGIPLHQLANQPLELPSLDLPFSREIYERLGAAPSLTAQVAILETWLLHCLHQQRTTSPLVVQSLQKFRAAYGQVSSKTMADSLFISQRQLERLYQTQVGMTPKEYSRLMRVYYARHVLKTQQQLSLARIGMLLEYYDQAHFTHEFKAILGITPHEYARSVEKSK